MPFEHEPAAALRRPHPGASVLGRTTAPPSGPLSLPPGAGVVVLADVPAPAGSAASALWALVALWLAREGRPVLMHRPGAGPRAAGAAEVLGTLGVMLATGPDEVADRWARREPAAVASEHLDDGPHSGAATWRLAAPGGPRRLLRVVPCDDETQGRAVADWALRSGAATLRVGPPGLCDAGRCPPVDVWIGGRARPDLGSAAHDEPPDRWAPLPRGLDLAGSALFVQEVLSGERPLPEPPRRLLGSVERTLAEAWA